MERNNEYYGVRSAGSHGIGDVILIPIDRDDLDSQRTPIICQLKRDGASHIEEQTRFRNLKLLNTIKWWVTKPKGSSFNELKIEVIR